jgi:hypothetical protein
LCVCVKALNTVIFFPCVQGIHQAKMGILRVLVRLISAAFLAGCAPYIPVYETQNNIPTTTGWHLALEANAYLQKVRYHWNQNRFLLLFPVWRCAAE